MTFTKTILAASLMTVAATTATFAADDRKFDGSYVGIEGGMDWTKLETDGKRDRSIYYGGIIGYRTQMDSGLVMGIEGTFGDTGYNRPATGAHTNYELSAGLTLGMAFGNDGANLLYGKAAYVRTRFDRSSAADDSYNDGGWRFGGGYERAINDNLSLRLSADYTTYGKDKSTIATEGRSGIQTKAGVLVKF